jgi:hypothetical protein
MMLSRREIFGVLFRALGSTPVAVARAELRIDRLRLENALPLRSCGSCSYRADVVVSVLGVRILSRANVGSAFMALRECSSADVRSTALQFTGESRPERAHGVRYTGSLEEATVEQGSTLTEAANFGFITASAEESYAEARQRVMAKGAALAAFIAVESVHRPGCASNSKAYVALPADSPTTDWRDLISQVRSLFSTARLTSSELNVPGGTARTFLYSILAAIRSPESVYSCDYVHNGNLFRLDCEKTTDRHTGEGLASKTTVAFARRVIRVAGRTRNQTNGRTSTFRFWLEEGSDYPLRIEFQPRSYLRIVLEFDPTIDVPINTKEAI